MLKSPLMFGINPQQIFEHHSDGITPMFYKENWCAKWGTDLKGETWELGNFYNDASKK